MKRILIDGAGHGHAPVVERATPVRDKKQEKVAHVSSRMLLGDRNTGRGVPNGNVTKMIQAYADWIYSCVELRSNYVSRLSWQAYKPSLTSQNARDLVEADHWLEQLYRRPNPYFPRQRIYKLISQYLDLTGDAYVLTPEWEGGPNKGLPSSMWVLPSHLVTVIPDRDNFIAGYEYKPPGGGKFTYEKRLVAHFQNPGPRRDVQRSLYYGYSPVEAVLDLVDLTRDVRRGLRNYLENGMMPGAAITLPASMGSDKVDNVANEAIEILADEFEEYYANPERAGRLIILRNGMTFEPIEMTGSIERLQGVDKENRENICAPFFVPPQMITGDSSARAVQETNEEFLVKYAITPIADMMDETFNLHWAQWEDNLEVEHERIHVANSTFHEKLWTSVATVDEQRREIGLPPLEDDRGKMLMAEFQKKEASSGSSGKDSATQ